MNHYYEIRKNTGWNANIRGLWVIVEDGWRAYSSYERRETAMAVLRALRG